MRTNDVAPPTSGRTITWARYYDAVVALTTLGRARAIRRETADLARIAPGDVVLDVGCGTGDLTLLAAERAGVAGRVHGIDAAPEMIAVAREKAIRAGRAVDFQVAAIEDLPFPDATFDVALSSLMMHHLPDDLKRRGLAEIRRVLKPGGRLVVVDFRRPTSRPGRIGLALLRHGALPSGVQDVAAMLAAAGFSDVETGPIGFRPLGFARSRARAAAAATVGESTAASQGSAVILEPRDREPGRSGQHGHGPGQFPLRRILPLVGIGAVLLAALAYLRAPALVAALGVGAGVIALHLLAAGLISTLTVLAGRRRSGRQRLTRHAHHAPDSIEDAGARDHATPSEP